MRILQLLMYGVDLPREQARRYVFFTYRSGAENQRISNSQGVKKALASNDCFMSVETIA